MELSPDSLLRNAIDALVLGCKGPYYNPLTNWWNWFDIRVFPAEGQPPAQKFYGLLEGNHRLQLSRLLMGHPLTPSIMQRFAQAVSTLLHRHFGVSMVAYLDGWLISRPDVLAQNTLLIMKSLASPSMPAISYYAYISVSLPRFTTGCTSPYTAADSCLYSSAFTICGQHTSGNKTGPVQGSRLHSMDSLGPGLANLHHHYPLQLEYFFVALDAQKRSTTKVQHPPPAQKKQALVFQSYSYLNCLSEYRTTKRLLRMDFQWLTVDCSCWNGSSDPHTVLACKKT